MTRFLIQSIFMLVALLTLGCGGGPNPDAVFSDNYDTDIKKLSTLYSSFQNRNGFVGPKDEQELRKYIDETSETRLQRIGIDKGSVDELFTSSRDGQPFKFRWSVKGGQGVPPRPIIFETQGVDGKYLVGFTSGSSQEFSKADYDKLWNGEGDDGSMTGHSSQQSGRPDVGGQ